MKALRASLTGQARRPGDLLGLEGAHLVQEAHAAGLSFQTVYLRQGSEVGLEQETDQGGDWRSHLRTANWAVLSPEVFDSAVSTVTPREIAATWVIQETVRKTPASHVLVLEGLQDPGNLGTLIRSAEAFGATRVMVTPDTVHHWNPKAVRAASGSVFRVPVVRLPLEEILSQLRAEGVRTFAAVAEAAPGGAVPSYDTDFSGRCALLIGNEGAGLSAKAVDLADARVEIPCEVESLNAAVAGSVLLYEAMRQAASGAPPSRALRTGAWAEGLRP